MLDCCAWDWGNFVRGDGGVGDGDVEDETEREGGLWLRCWSWDYCNAAGDGLRKCGYSDA